MQKLLNFLLLILVCIFECRRNLWVESFSSAPFSSVHETGIQRIHLSKAKRINHSCSRLYAEKDDDAAKALQEQAAALRREVEAFEASKQEENDKIEFEAKEQQRAKDELRLRYSAEVPILKGDGSIVMERCDFPPRMTKKPQEGEEPGPLSRIVAIQAPLPLGIVLGQDEELPVAQRPTTIDEVAPGSNGEQAGVRVGDCLRACTACQVTMEQPTWQLIAGGIGRPKTTRMMFSTDSKPFEEVMDAIASNAMDPEARDVWLVVERMDEE